MRASAVCNRYCIVVGTRIHQSTLAFVLSASFREENQEQRRNAKLSGSCIKRKTIKVYLESKVSPWKVSPREMSTPVKKVPIHLQVSAF